MAKKPETQAPEQTQSEAPAADAPKQSGKLTPVKKITVKTVFGEIKIKDIPEGQELPVMRVAGYASDIKSGTTNYGDWDALVGDFSCINRATGEIFVSKTCLIPGAMGEFLVQGLRSALEKDAGAQMKFGVDVSVKVSARDANKYEFVVRPVIEQEQGAASTQLLLAL